MVVGVAVVSVVVVVVVIVVVLALLCVLLPVSVFIVTPASNIAAVATTIVLVRLCVGCIDAWVICSKSFLTIARMGRS